MATPRFSDPASKISGINEPSVENVLSTESMPTAGDFTKPRRRPRYGICDDCRGPYHPNALRGGLCGECRRKLAKQKYVAKHR